MYNITLIYTKHEETGNCNSIELLKIIESISPEIIFEELSYSNFAKSYEKESLINLETNAIKKHLQNHSIKHIPVDTYELPNSYYEELDIMYNRILNNNRIIESRDLRNLIDEQLLLETYQGFCFLNSNQNDEIIEKINILEERILDIIKDEKLFRINRLKKEVIEKREEEIIQNIYNYSKEYKYTKAILFIGSGHRKSIINRIEKYKMREDTKLNWMGYNDL